MTFLIGVSILILFLEVLTTVPLKTKRNTESINRSFKVLTLNARFYPPNYFFDEMSKDNIDLGCFQEVKNAAAAKYLDRLKGNGFNGFYGDFLSTSDESSDGVLILSRSPVERIDIIDCPSERTERRRFGVYKTEYTGEDIYIIGLHLEPVEAAKGLKILAATWKARYKQALLVSRIARNLPGRALILGDYNSTPTDRIVRVLKRGFNDSWFESGFGPGLTWHRDAPLFRIDYILSRGFETAAQPQLLKIFRSDHISYRVELLKKN